MNPLTGVRVFRGTGSRQAPGGCELFLCHVLGKETRGSMEGGLCEAHSPGIRSIPAQRASSFTHGPSPRDHEQACGVLGLPLAAPSIPRPGSLSPCPFSPSPSGLSPVQPKPSWRRTLAAAGTQSPGAGQEERGLGRQDGGLGGVQHKGRPLLPGTPAPRGLPCISRGEPRGPADLHAAPLPEGCAGEGRSPVRVVWAGSAEVGAWKKHFQDGVCAHCCRGAQREGRAGSWVPPISSSQAAGASSGSRGWVPRARAPESGPVSLLSDSAGHAEEPRFKGKEGPHHTKGLMEELTKNPGVMTSLTSGTSLREYGVQDALTGGHHGG